MQISAAAQGSTYPPSISKSLPVIYVEASLARYKYNPLISLTWPCLPNGAMRYASFTTSGPAPIFVSKKPGDTIFTRAKSLHSRASDFPKCVMNALLPL